MLFIYIHMNNVLKHHTYMYIWYVFFIHFYIYLKILRHRSFCVLANPNQQSLYGFSFIFNAIPCYFISILPLYFHGPLNFALVKCRPNLISPIISAKQGQFYDAIFLNFVKMSCLVVCTCYFDRCPFDVQWPT